MIRYAEELDDRKRTKKTHQISKHKNHYLIDNVYVLTGIENALTTKNRTGFLKKIIY